MKSGKKLILNKLGHKFCHFPQQIFVNKFYEGIFLFAYFFIDLNLLPLFPVLAFEPKTGLLTSAPSSTGFNFPCKLSYKSAAFCLEPNISSISSTDKVSNSAKLFTLFNIAKTFLVEIPGSFDRKSWTAGLNLSVLYSSMKSIDIAAAFRKKNSLTF